MNEQMEFPETFEKFAKEYGFKDDVYTNGSDLIQVFRVKQWLEHDNKLRRIETDTAYECGKHANKWIPVSERLPEAEYGESDSVLVCFEDETQDVLYFNGGNWCYPTGETYISVNHKNGWHNKVVAWMPLPKSYKTEESEGYEINRQNN